jgi:hypothetical protein
MEFLNFCYRMWNNSMVPGLYISAAAVLMAITSDPFRPRPWEYTYIYMYVLVTHIQGLAYEFRDSVHYALFKAGRSVFERVHVRWLIQCVRSCAWSVTSVTSFRLGHVKILHCANRWDSAQDGANSEKFCFRTGNRVTETSLPMTQTCDDIAHYLITV